MIQLQARRTTARDNLVMVLRPWRRQLLLQQGTHWTARGLVTGIVLACLVQLISRLVPWAGALYWAAGIALLSILLALGAALWYRPTFATTARRVDRKLTLHDRLSTAWELREEVSPLATLQRRDALQQLQTHTPGNALSLRPHRPVLITMSIVLLALVLLLILPNPMDSVLRQQAAFQNTLTKQIAHIEQTRKQLLHQPGVTPQQQKQIDKILNQLEQKLQQAKNNTQAQQALADAQAQLNQLRNPNTANRIQGHNAASAALQSSSSPTASAIGQALNNNDPKQLANALKNLGSQVSKMTPAQRSQLAQQLEQAANQAGQNPKLSAALHQLAKSVANGSQSDINDAVNAVQDAGQQDANDASQNAAISKAQQGVQQAANLVAAANDGSNPQSQAQQSQNQGQSGQQEQGQQGQQGQGKGQGQGQGQGKGQGQGQGQGQSQGQGQGQGKGSSGGSGHGNGAGNNASSQSGKQEQVTVPGQIGSGTSVQNQNPGNNGVVQGGSSVPYSQVVQQYNQAAHDAIDNSSIPDSQKDLVHGYFNSLEGQ